MQGSGGRKIPLLPARLSAFMRKGGTPSACFCRRRVCKVQDRCGNALVVLLVWRSLRGLFKPLCISGRATLKILGRLWRIRFRGSCMVRGPRGQGGSRARAHASASARAPLRDAKHQARGRTPGTTHTSELAPDRREPFAWVYQITKMAAHPRKDLHTSRLAAYPCNGLAPCPPSSCKNRRRECRLSAKKRKGAPEGAVFCALRNPALPPEYLNRSTKCAAFDADLVAAPAPCRSGGGLEGDEVPPPIPTTG